MKKTILTAVFIAATSMSQLAVADAKEARARLDSFFTKVTSLKGSFKQQVFDKKGKGIQSSTGLMYMSRPGRFRWVYMTPEPQELISDGKNLWIYDEDLEQVTIKPITSAVSATPMSFLTRKDAPAARFHIQALPARGGQDWFTLTPKTASRDFKKIEMGLDAKGDLKRMVMFDQLGQRTEITLNTQSNIPISGGTFYFTPPKGVDVIGKAR
jgi:outer membrane lipoprotein carrier protein